MIKKLIITNYLGESMPLELRFPEKSGFLVRGIDGLTPPKANINFSDIAIGDGGVFNSASVSKRNIVLSLGLLAKPTIEDTRQKAYKYFPIKQRVNIRIETTNRICETYGYVESHEPEIFTQDPSSIISIICPDSYLYSVEKNITIFSGAEKLFEFPFSNESLTEKLIEFGRIQTTTVKSIEYEGDAPVGLVIRIHATGPVGNLRISNAITREVMDIDATRLVYLTGSSIVEGDDIIISTIRGDKFIYLQRGGQLYNVLGSQGEHLDWFQLQKGTNVFAYVAESGGENLQFSIENQIAYEGV